MYIITWTRFQYPGIPMKKIYPFDEVHKDNNAKVLSEKTASCHEIINPLEIIFI